MFPSNFTHYAIASVGLHLASPYKLAATMGPLKQPFKQGLNIGYFKYVFASLNREWAEWVWGYNAAQRLWIITHRTKHQTGLPKFKYRLHPEVAINPIEQWLCEDPSAPKRPHHGTWVCTFTYVDLRWATYGQRWYLKRTEHRDGHIEWTEERAEENEQYYEVVEYPHNQWGVPAFVNRGRGAFVGEADVQYGYDVERED